jgi:hypothetical protein
LQSARRFHSMPTNWDWFDGKTYDPARDSQRLRMQLNRVWMLMVDGQWRTLGEISLACQGSEAAVSARLRDFRKKKFGAHVVERRYLHNGLWQYRIVVRRSQSAAANLTRKVWSPTFFDRGNSV